VVAFGIVELQGAGERVQDAVGGADQAAAFEPDVVVRGYSGEEGAV